MVEDVALALGVLTLGSFSLSNGIIYFSDKLVMQCQPSEAVELCH